MITAWGFIALYGLLLTSEGVIESEGLAAGPGWRQEYSFQGGSELGTAILMVAKSNISTGENLDLRLVVRCDEGALRLFNPFFNPDLPSPARLAVFDDEKQYYGELIAPGPDRRTTRDVTPRDWVLVRGLCSAGARFRFRLDDSLRFNERIRGSSLTMRPGKYFVQAIYSHRAHQRGPTTGEQSGKESAGKIDVSTQNASVRTLWRSGSRQNRNEMHRNRNVG